MKKAFIGRKEEKKKKAAGKQKLLSSHRMEGSISGKCLFLRKIIVNFKPRNSS